MPGSSTMTATARPFTSSETDVGMNTSPSSVCLCLFKVVYIPFGSRFECPRWPPRLMSHVRVGSKNGRDALEMGCLYYPRKQTSVSYAADCTPSPATVQRRSMTGTSPPPVHCVGDEIIRSISYLG